MNLNSIKTRIVALSVVSLFATTATLVGYNMYATKGTNMQVETDVSAMLDAKSKEALLTLASTQAGLIRVEVDAAFEAARNIASAMEVVADDKTNPPDGLRREQLNKLLRNVLEDNPRFNGTYSAWEPDGLDGNDAQYKSNAALGSDATGRALPYWTRDAGGKIAVQPLVEYDSRDRHPNGLVKGGWFIGPKETGHENILAPLPYVVQGKPVFLATMSVPISASGKFLGVAGADFNLDFVQKLATDVKSKIYGGAGDVTIVNQDGLVVASSLDPGGIGGPLSKFDIGWQEDLQHVGKNREEVYVNLDQDRLKLFSPIPLGRTGSFWSVIIGVPRSVVMRDASALLGNMASRQADQSFWQIIVSLGVTVAGALAMWLVSLSVATPIQRLTAAMEGLARRQTGIVVPGTRRKDEIGVMARTVGVIQENAVEDARRAAEENAAQEARAAIERKATMAKLADDFEHAIGGIVSRVSSAAGQLQSAATTLTATAEDTSTKSGAVAQASEEATANVNMVASASEELASSVREISRQVSDSARMAANAVQEAAGTAETVKELANAAQRIGEIVDLIGNVAGQTNLLALNATIEAARAGEAGKGFAVVAAEVKGLADQTAKAAGQISSQITGIQQSTNGAVTAINSISSTIEQMNEIAAIIASAVEEQAATTQEIARNVQHASTGTAEVSVNISAVTRAAEDTSSAATQVLSSSGDLSMQSDLLSREVGTFLSTVRMG